MAGEIDLDLLRAFVTVVDCGSFSRAAERLLRNQSTISLKLKRLEDRVGAPLLIRSPRHVELTPEGEAILGDARRMLNLSDAMMARVKEPEMSGVVRLGAPEDFATTHLPSVLARFSESHPQVSLEVPCALTLELVNAFSAGELDLALVKRDPHDQGPAADAAASSDGPAPKGVDMAQYATPSIGSFSSDGTRIWREPLVWAAAERFSDSLTERQSSAVPLVVSPRPCVYRNRAVKALGVAKRDWRIVYTCASLSGTQAAVRAGLGITVLPKEMVPADFVILNAANSDLPDLHDTEIALLVAPQISRPAHELKDFVVRSLSHTIGR